MALSASHSGDTSATMTSPVPAAHLGAHPMRSAGMDHGILPLSPQHPQAGLGMLQGTGLTFDWHLVWQESLQPAGRKKREGYWRQEGEQCQGAGCRYPTCRTGRGSTRLCRAQSTLALGTGCWDVHMHAHTSHWCTHIPGGTSTAQ